MDRENREVVTPVKAHKVVLTTYLTGREFEYVQAPLLQAMTVKAGGIGQDVQMGNIDISKIQESTHRLIEKVVVSVDGNSDKVLDLILDMHQEDYQFVLDAVNELSKKK